MKNIINLKNIINIIILIMILKTDISFIFFYIAGFGFSEFIIEYYKIKGRNFLLYHLLILIIGIIIYIC